ncbi:MAG TPA: electron transport complex subunit E [Gemmatimonadales bacterium]|nr:electron transport complex subunit E [Gemmatimonadales bacterium]
MSPAKPSTATQDLLRCVWKENPTLVQVLGMCPTLAVTNSVANCLGMGAATMFVLVGSSALVSAVRKMVPNEVRITTYILIIATFVTVADMALAATAPAIHKALGAFVALIVVNCIILGRAEAFASKNTVWRSTLDAIGNGIGFIWMMLVMGSVREVLGNGTWLGFRIFGENFEPWVIMILPPGGFLTLGSIMLIVGAWKHYQGERAKARDLALALQGKAA